MNIFIIGIIIISVIAYFSIGLGMVYWVVSRNIDWYDVNSLPELAVWVWPIPLMMLIFSKVFSRVFALPIKFVENFIKKAKDKQNTLGNRKKNLEQLIDKYRCCMKYDNKQIVALEEDLEDLKEEILIRGIAGIK